MEANEAVVNVTYSGKNGDLQDAVLFDSRDAEILTWVTEAVQNGSILGIPADANANFDGFVVDRFAADGHHPNRIQVRPKTPFGK